MPGTKDQSNNSLLKYYQEQDFNPVPIDVEDRVVWEAHAEVRRNLYEKRLMIPLSFFKERAVLEFGCNSGENALHLASIGSKMTLVEPNDMVLPRLKTLFKNCGFEDSIDELVNTDIDGFNAKRSYDIVLAEGFLAALADRDEALLKICGFLAPGGMGVVSFDDSYGSLLEVTRQLILRRACQLKGIDDVHSDEAMTLAKELYAEDLAGLNAARKFEPWCKDNLLNPFVAWEYLWDFPRFIPLLEKAGCEFYSSSPKWTFIDHYSWWKNTLTVQQRHEKLLEEWYGAFPFFLTGLPLSNKRIEPANKAMVEVVAGLIKAISDYTACRNTSMDPISYPAELDEYFKRSNDPEFMLFNDEMKRLFAALKGSSAEDVVSTYRNAKSLRKLWGTPCHYVSFIKGEVNEQ